ncbi:MAG TPA: hypothetical protein VFO21_24360 [Vicinamibacterales bacterium]|nr:hypothetical protein [Vicinamibacterales bacterium]
MIRKTILALSVAAATAGAMSAHAMAQDAVQPPLRVSGTFNDYVWVEGGAGAGAWHVSGEWAAQVRGNSGKGDFTGSLLGVRSDLWVLQTFADPANPALRSPHTHHVGLADADVTILPNGVRLEGVATITANGALAPYSGSTVRVDITGGNTIRYSNIKMTFTGAGVDHFGPQPYEGLVVLGR